MIVSTPVEPDPKLECDFCSARAPTHAFCAVSFVSHSQSPPGLTQISEGDWAACDICADLVVKEHWHKLAWRAAEEFLTRHHGFMPVRLLAQEMYDLHDEFRRAML